MFLLAEPGQHCVARLSSAGARYASSDFMKAYSVNTLDLCDDRVGETSSLSIVTSCAL